MVGTQLLDVLRMLVINPTQDRMTDPALTRRNYEPLGGPKQYAEIDYGHWALAPDFVADWGDVVDRSAIGTGTITWSRPF